MEAELFTHLRRAFIFGDHYPQPFIRFMLEDHSAWRSFLRSTRRLRAASVASFVPGRLWPEATWPFRLGAGAPLLRAYLGHAWRARGCGRLVEKTPTNTAHLAKLKAAFPRSRLLYIHRHPVDVYSSHRRRAHVDPEGAWAVMDVDEFCRRYEQSTKLVLRWLDTGHSDLMLVGYEAFVRDPAEVIAEVCAFLDEPFLPEAVEEREPQPGKWRADLTFGPASSRERNRGPTTYPSGRRRSSSIGLRRPCRFLATDPTSCDVLMTDPVEQHLP